MKHLFFAACGLLLLGACAVDEEVDQDIGGAYVNGVFVAYCSAEVAPVIYSKNGLPMIDDHACIPEPEVLGEFVKLGGPDGPAEPIPGPPSDCVEGDCPILPPPPPGCEENCGPPPPPPGGCDNGGANPGNRKCVGNASENPNNGVGWKEKPGETGRSGNNGNGNSKGIDHLSTAEQAFMLWDYNNRVDYEAYWQWLLDNGLVLAE